MRGIRKKEARAGGVEDPEGFGTLETLKARIRILDWIRGGKKRWESYPRYLIDSK